MYKGTMAAVPETIFEKRIKINIKKLLPLK
jgi:hypothetical protein